MGRLIPGMGATAQQGAQVRVGVGVGVGRRLGSRMVSRGDGTPHTRGRR